MNRDLIEKLRNDFEGIWVDQAAYPALLPGGIDDVMKVINWCRVNGMRLLVAGKGHSFSSGFKVPDNVLSLITLSRNGISEADPLDLTVEVEAGVPVASMTGHVKAAGFRLDDWPEDYTGTVGGLICGGNGVSVRHLILGVDMIDGRGRNLRFGGRIRKNVSGFDVSGLFAGSRGRIGWLDRVFLRLTPLQAPKTGFTARRPKTSGQNCNGLYERIASAFDPDGVFLKSLS